jgi:hypothetical protein
MILDRNKNTLHPEMSASKGSYWPGLFPPIYFKNSIYYLFNNSLLYETLHINKGLNPNWTNQGHPRSQYDFTLRTLIAI